MLSSVFLIILYALIALSPIVAVACLWMKGEMTLMHETGTSLAFAAFGIIALQPVLVSRWKWMERPFGLDVISRFHRYMGLFAVGLLLAHPPLMAFGGAGVNLLTTLDLPWYVLLGKAMLVLLVIHVCVSVWYPSFGLTFERWRSYHNAMAVLIVTGAFVHSWWAGYDLGPIPMRVLWLVLFGLAAFAYVHHKVLVPRRLRRFPYRVEAVEQENRNVWTVKLAPAGGERVYDYHPGQFHFITLLRERGLPVEEHHWTISSSPAQRDFISSTIKESGDFTATIGKTLPGDLALVDGPFGRFSYTFHSHENDYVFIAGGIGITPIMSMLRHMRDTGKAVDALLLYGNRTEKDIVFREELAEIEASAVPHLKVVHILSSPEDGWRGETGHVDTEKLRRLIKFESPKTVFYICAPPGMTKKVVEGLRSLGVPYGRMHTEQFSL